MDRRRFLKAATSLAATSVVGADASPRRIGNVEGAPRDSLSGASRPNILLIMADDMGYSDIGCYGGEIPTPNLDRLATEGLRFTRFYNAARCCPTRASLLTGLYPHEAGIGRMVYRNDGPGYSGRLNERCVTLAEVLQSAGYRTSMAGKWHVGHQPGVRPTDRGFDRFYGIHRHVDSYYRVLKGCTVYLDDEEVIPETEDPTNHLRPDQDWYTTDVFTDYALSFIEEAADSGGPFFHYLAYNAPHFPLEAPTDDIERFRGRYMDGWDVLREEKFERMLVAGIIPETAELSPPENVPWNGLSEDDRRNLDFRRAIYAAQIARMDRNIGRLLDRLEQRGILDETLILFLSDNGCSAEVGMFGMNWDENRIENWDEWREKGGWSVSQGRAWANASNAPFRLFKKWVHEGGIATPLIARGPGVPARGGLTHEVGHVIDVMATCCEVAGASYPSEFAGRQIRPLRGQSLVPVLNGRSRLGHEALYWEHLRHAAIRTGRWKLVSRDDERLRWELYDLDADRTELVDVSSFAPNRVSDMRAQWQAWAEETNVLPWPAERR